MSIQARKRHDGSTVYDVIVDLGPDPDTGKRRQEKRTFTAKTEAKAYERRRRTEIAAGGATTRVREPLKVWATTWLDTIVAIRCEESTLRSYRWDMEKRILPELGAVPLCELTTVRIQRWIAKLATTPTKCREQLSDRSVQSAYRTLHMALNAAVRQHMLTRNPADGVTLPKSGGGKIRKAAWTAEEAATFLAVACRDEPYEPLWSLAVLTGMRRGELLGIRWQDINWQSNSLMVRQTITARSGPAKPKPPKNPTSARMIPLPPQLIELLAAHQARQAVHIEECADAYDPHDLVCANDFGRPWHPDTVTHRFKKLVELAGVPEVNLHYTRHAYASIAINGGQTLKAVSEVLGHADPRTTIQFYQHVDAEQHRGVGAAVAQAVMSHFEADVTWHVTCEPRTAENPAANDGVPLELLARPAGLEPATFRSGITRAPLPLPLNTRRRSMRRAPTKAAPPEKTEGREVS